MLIVTYANSVPILKCNDHLYNYTSSVNLSHGLNLQCYIKNLGGGSKDELGKNNILCCLAFEHIGKVEHPVLIISCMLSLM